MQSFEQKSWVICGEIRHLNFRYGDLLYVNGSAETPAPARRFQKTLRLPWLVTYVYDGDRTTAKLTIKTQQRFKEILGAPHFFRMIGFPVKHLLELYNIPGIKAFHQRSRLLVSDINQTSDPQLR